MIVKSSVDNEHIESLCQDVHCGVVSPYKEMFTRLEREGVYGKLEQPSNIR